MDRDRTLRSAIRFGEFEVDLRSGELRRDGVRIKLQDQPLQILAMLLEQPGQVVTREKLRDRLWPSDTFVDFDHSLNKAINKLREALMTPQRTHATSRLFRAAATASLVPSTEARDPETRRAIDSIVVFSAHHPTPGPDLEYLSVGIPGSIIHASRTSRGLASSLGTTFFRSTRREKDPLGIGRSSAPKHTDWPYLAARVKTSPARRSS